MARGDTLSECKEFGAALRRERERRGIALDAVAERTKIGLALLAGLERGDLTRWPSGIFRRAFIRAYADAIGLSPDEVVATSERVFLERAGDGDVSLVSALGRGMVPADRLRLTLASAPRKTARAWMLRAASLATDLLAVSGAGTALGLTIQQPASLVTLAVGALYFGAGTLLLETSPATWALRRAFRPKPAPAAPSLDADADLQAGAENPSRVAGRSDPASRPPRAPARARGASPRDAGRAAPAAVGTCGRTPLRRPFRRWSGCSAGSASSPTPPAR